MSPGMSISTLLLCLFAWGGGAQVAAQTAGPDLVQAAVHGLADQDRVRQATTIVKGLPGVIMARFDIPTRNMMLHVTPDAALDAALLNALLQPHGISVRCYQRQAANAAPFRHVDADLCGGETPIER